MMAVKMVECVLCGETVTKRNTLSMREIGGDRGRACRSHPQVQELQKTAESERQSRKSLEDVSRRIRVMMGIAAVRMMHSIRGMPVEFVYSNLGQTHSKYEMTEIRAGVEEQGGPLMTPDEVTTSVLSALEMRKRGHI
jgi:hypothetical protein